MKEITEFSQLKEIQEEQLPVPRHKLHDWTHFAGLYAADKLDSDYFSDCS